jgi:hypothetical protein
MCHGVAELSSAAFKSSYQPVKELLDVSDAGIKISNMASEIPYATSEIPGVTSEISHAISKVV